MSNAKDSLLRFAELNITELAAENEKLRDLCKDLYSAYRFAHNRMRYVVLGHEAEVRAIEQRMRELGVEVER